MNHIFNSVENEWIIELFSIVEYLKVVKLILLFHMCGIIEKKYHLHPYATCITHKKRNKKIMTHNNIRTCDLSELTSNSTKSTKKNQHTNTPTTNQINLFTKLKTKISCRKLQIYEKNTL